MDLAGLWTQYLHREGNLSLATLDDSRTSTPEPSLVINLPPHHMPQAAAKFTTREEGGALALPHEEHVLTRTYGVRGRTVVRAEAGLPFRQVLARDIRDVRYITGAKYDKGLRELIAYYRANFPELLQKLPRSRSQ